MFKMFFTFFLLHYTILGHATEGKKKILENDPYLPSSEEYERDDEYLKCKIIIEELKNESAEVRLKRISREMKEKSLVEIIEIISEIFVRDFPEKEQMARNFFMDNIDSFNKQINNFSEEGLRGNIPMVVDRVCMELKGLSNKVYIISHMYTDFNLYIKKDHNSIILLGIDSI